jgi:hypothetical protein
LTLTTIARHIDASVSNILSITSMPLSIQIPELAAAVRAMRTASAPAGINLPFGAGTRTASSESPRNTAPVSREERMVYSLEERRDTLGIEVSTAAGTSARITRKPRSANISLVTSGGNT